MDIFKCGWHYCCHGNRKKIKWSYLAFLVDNKNHLVHLVYTIEQFTKANCPKTGSIDME